MPYQFEQSVTLTHGPKLYTSMEWVWHKLHNQFYLIEDWTAPSGYYGIKIHADGSAWLWTKPGFQWDGASLYPDFDYMLFPSMIHDCLHWMIMHGVIDEHMNDLIDKELGDCVRYGKTPIPWYKGGEYTRKYQAWKVEKATHTVNQRRFENGVEHDVETITI